MGHFRFKKHLSVVGGFILLLCGCHLDESSAEKTFRKNIIGKWKDPNVTGSGFKFGRFKMESLDSLLFYGEKTKYEIIEDTLIIWDNKNKGTTFGKSKIISITKDSLVLIESPGIKTIYVRKK